MTVVLLELDHAALELWGLRSLVRPREKACKGRCGQVEPSRIANLRKSRERIRATQKKIAAGVAVDVRQRQAMARLGEIETALRDYDSNTAAVWKARLDALLARPKPSSGQHNCTTTQGCSLLVRDLHALLVDFDDSEQLSEVCTDVIRHVLAEDDQYR